MWLFGKCYVRTETSMIELLYESHHRCLKAYVSRHITPRFSEIAQLLKTSYSHAIKELDCESLPENFKDLELKA